MRRVVTVGLVLAISLLGMPMGIAAAAQKGGTVNGKAEQCKSALSNHTVRARNVKTGEIAGTTITNSDGEFTFAALAASDYVFEVVDAQGKVLGVSQATPVLEGVIAKVTISLSGPCAAAVVGHHGGLSIFGLGQPASYALLAAAGTAAVVGIVAANNNASPSK
jgi:hypothetical protein